MSTTQRLQLTREAICELPGPERLPYVQQVRVMHPQWVRISKVIAESHAQNATAAEPQCLLLTGPTGVGKSTLIDSYAQQHPCILTETGKIQPILKATIPAPATVKSLFTALLAAIGDPRAHRGTVTSMSVRLMQFIADCHVEMMMLDELQHVVDRDSEVVLRTVSDALKTLIKETKVACVLVGLQGEAERVVSTNPQLARLFGDPIVLAPFEWDEARSTTIDTFRTLLQHIERFLPLREPSQLATRERAWRCFVASQGIVSYLMALVRQATFLALTTGREHLDDDLLAHAFTRRLAGERRGIANPFLGEPPVTATPSPPPPPSAHKGKSRQSRTAKGETMRDILAK
jgi:hypothetical protein